MAANQEFADKDAVAEVIAKFKEILNNLTKSQLNLDAKEKANREEYTKRVTETNDDTLENKNAIAASIQKLAENAENTENQKLLKDLRTKDLVDTQKDLEEENNDYEKTKSNYEDLKKQLHGEIEGINKANAVFQSADFADYIADRLNQKDGLVSKGMAADQAHGQGIEVLQQ